MLFIWLRYDVFLPICIDWENCLLFINVQWYCWAINGRQMHEIVLHPTELSISISANFGMMQQVMHLLILRTLFLHGFWSRVIWIGMWVELISWYRIRISFQKVAVCQYPRQRQQKHTWTRLRDCLHILPCYQLRKYMSILKKIDSLSRKYHNHRHWFIIVLICTRIYLFTDQQNGR